MSNTSNNIERGIYEGYLWFSDADAPVVLDGEELAIDFDQVLTIKGKDYDLPSKKVFIVEAQLFDKDNNISYSVKYVDGQHLVKRYEVNPLDYNRKETDLKQYYGNGMNKWLQFLQYWELQEDSFCCGMDTRDSTHFDRKRDMETWVPKGLVFVGFINKKEDSNG